MSANKGIFFGGRGIIIPGAYSVFDASALRPNRLSPANTLLVIATGRGGEPNVPHIFNSPNEARQTIRSGTALDLLELAYNPSPQLQGAGKTVYLRLNLAVQAALNLQDVTPEDVLTVTSEDYGVENNEIQAKIEAGTLAGVKITVQDPSPDRATLEVGEDLGPMFEVQYTGASEESLLTVTLAGDDAITLAMDTSGAVTPTPTDDFTLDLALIQYNTVVKIVEFINSHASYTAQIIYQADGSMPSEKLDAVAAVDIQPAAIEVLANIGAIEHWADRFSSLVDIARIATKRAAPDPVAFTNLTGGAEGDPPDADRWATVLAQAEDVECSIVIAGTEDLAFQAMVLAHIENMNDVKAKRERIGLVGGAVGVTPTVATQNALELTSSYLSYVYPGIKTRDVVTGDLTVLSSMYSAALVAGMVAGSPASTSVTNKQIRVGGLERILSDTELELLLDGGVLPLEFRRTEGIFKVVQGLTTWLADANVILRKIIGIRVAQFVIVELRNTADPFVGETADKTTIQSLQNAEVAKLNLLIRTPGNPNGVLTEGVDENDEEQPAWRNLVLDYDGLEVVAINVDVSPVGEIAYIPITVNLIPNRIRLAA